MKNNSYILTVNLNRITLNLSQLVDLAGEFFGKTLEVPNSTTEIDIEFVDNFIFDEKIKATECRKQFSFALNSFLKK